MLFCHTVLPDLTLGKNSRIRTRKQAKMDKKQPNMAVTKQTWLKTDKHSRKTDKIWRKK